MRLHHRILFAIARPALAAGPARPRLILIVGCMRSGSSLLTHILTSNPEIAGFGESHVRYRSRRDLLELQYWTLRFRRRWPGRSRYLLDKVLHDGHLPDVAALAGWVDLRVVLLVRSPAGNIASLERMFARQISQDGSPRARRPAQARDGGGNAIHAADYYRDRLGQISAMLDRLPAEVPLIALGYDDLVCDPAPPLRRLDRFLGLARPLSPTYDRHSASGRWGTGDGSDAIRTGHVVTARPGAGSQADAAPVPADARAAYQALLHKLGRRDPGFGAAAEAGRA